MKLDIEKFRPCKDGEEWYNQQKSSIEAWSSCHRGDWMLWIAEELGVDEKKLILAAAKCANTVRHLMKDERSRNAVDIFIAYGEGRATLEELEEARKETADASMAAEASMAADASMAAEAAYYAARAARAATARAAYWVFRATHYAADAAYSAGGSMESKKANELETANICREILTDDIIEILQKQ